MESSSCKEKERPARAVLLFAEPENRVPFNVYAQVSDAFTAFGLLSAVLLSLLTARSAITHSIVSCICEIATGPVVVNFPNSYAIVKTDAK
jgi:hypothetical protein